MPFDITNPPSVSPPSVNTDFSQPQNQTIGNVSCVDKDPKPPSISVISRDKKPLSKPSVSYVDEVIPSPTYGNIIFDKMTGFPQTIGVITITSANGDTRTITINEKGSISY